MNIDIGRVAKCLNDRQKYILGFAWVIPDEIQLLEAFPHVIMIDTTEKKQITKKYHYTYYRR